MYDSHNDLQSKFMLHWLHGLKREQSFAKDRNIQPNRSFKTNNFFIEKKVFNKVRFNENIQGYGHEDTLFGYELDKQNFTIFHIDNPVVHLGLESSEEFLRKTIEILKWCGLPTVAPKVDRQLLKRALKLDKKVKSGHLFFILPLDVGSIEIVGDVTEDELLSVL